MALASSPFRVRPPADVAGNALLEKSAVSNPGHAGIAAPVHLGGIANAAVLEAAAALDAVKRRGHTTVGKDGTAAVVGGYAGFVVHHGGSVKLRPGGEAEARPASPLAAAVDSLRRRVQTIASNTGTPASTALMAPERKTDDTSGSVPVPSDRNSTKPKRNLSEDIFDRQIFMAPTTRRNPVTATPTMRQASPTRSTPSTPRGQARALLKTRDSPASTPGSPQGRTRSTLRASQTTSSPSRGAMTPARETPARETPGRRRSSPGRTLPMDRFAVAIEPRLCGQKIMSVGSFDGDVRCVASVSIAQTFFVWCGERNGSVTLRDPETGAVRKRLAREEGASATDGVCCMMQVEAEVWMGTSCGRMRIYCALSHQLLVERMRHAGGICAMTSLSRCVYSASTDLMILEWDQQARDTTTKIFGEHKNPVRSLCLCGGYLVSGSDDCDIRVWDIATAQTTFIFHCSDGVAALSHVPMSTSARGGEDTLWAGDSSGTITVYDWREMRCVKEHQAHTGPICTLLCKQGLVFSSSTDKTVKVWHADTCTCAKVLNDSVSYVSSLVAIASNVQTRLWAVSCGRKLQAWSLEQRGAAVEDAIHLQDESDHLSLRVQSLEDQLAAAQASEKAARAEADRARAEADASTRTWRVTEQNLLDQLAELRVQLRDALQQRDGDLSALKLELEKDLGQNSKTDSTKFHELSELLKSMTDHEQTKMPVDKAGLLASNMVSRPDSPSKEVSQLVEAVEQALVSQHGTPCTPAPLKGDLNEEQVSMPLETAEQAARGPASDAAMVQIKQLEKQIDDDIGRNISRLAFISEIWSVYRQVFDSQRNVEAAACSRSPTPGGAPKAVSAQDKDLQAALQAITRARDQCAAVIHKYLTDHEKLHLGIPAQFKGVFDVEKLLDGSKTRDSEPLTWTQTSETIPSQEPTPSAPTSRASPGLTGAAAVAGNGVRMVWAPRARSPQQPGQRQQRQLRPPLQRTPPTTPLSGA